MAVSPLFLLDMDALKGRLRLDGVDIDDSAQNLLDGAARSVRAKFNARLGVTRVGELVALTSVENPLTEDEILRSIAEEVEAKWIWVELTRNLPIKFFDNSGDDLEQYNVEGAFRSIDPERIQGERDRCLEEIENWLPILAGDVPLGEVQLNKAHTQGDMPGGRPYPLGTLVGQNKNLFGNIRRFRTNGG